MRSPVTPGGGALWQDSVVDHPGVLLLPSRVALLTGVRLFLRVLRGQPRSHARLP